MKQLIFVIIIIIPIIAISQTQDSVFTSKALNSKSLNKIQRDIKSLENTVERKTLKALERFQRQEDKIHAKLSKVDSIAAKGLFNVKAKYQKLIAQLQSPEVNNKLKEYIPNFDSISTAFNFLSKANTITSKMPKDWSNKIQGINDDIKGLGNKLQTANDIKAYIKERRELIKQELEKYGLSKQLKKFNKEAYYYQQQLEEYKAMLHDRKSVEQKAIAQLRKLPAFTEFIRKNSQLAQLFRMPNDYGTAEALAGLQTRASIQSITQQRFNGSGLNPQQYVQQQMQTATTALNKLKVKINELGGSTSEIEMPDFKPNSQKTKSFLTRFDYNANIQSQKTNGILPSMSDLAITAGYKLNDKSVIGLGAAYKLGWGNNVRHVHITNQGVGLRSYLDIKIKNSIWLSGGFEMNYFHAFTKVEQFQQIKAWQSSGLLGVTKRYKVGNKSSNFQVLWDFLSSNQIPQKPKILFRIGYVIK